MSSKTDSTRRIYLSDSRALRQSAELREYFGISSATAPFKQDITAASTADVTGERHSSTELLFKPLDEAAVLSICNPIMVSPIYDPMRHDRSIHASVLGALAELVKELKNSESVGTLLMFPTLVNGIIRQLASQDEEIEFHCIQCITLIATLNSSVGTLIDLNILPVIKLILDRALCANPLDEILVSKILFCIQLLCDVRTEDLFMKIIDEGFIPFFQAILTQQSIPMKIKHSVIYAVGNLTQYIESEEAHQHILPIIDAIIDVMYSTSVSAILDDCCWIFHFITSSYTLPIVASIRVHFLEQGVISHVINHLYKSSLMSCQPGLYLLRNLVYDEQTALAIHRTNSRFVPFLFSSVLVSNMKVREIIYSIMQSLSASDDLLIVLLNNKLQKVIMQGLCTNSPKIVYNSFLIWSAVAQSPLTALNYDINDIRALNQGLRMSIRMSQNKNIIACLTLIKCLLEESSGCILDHLISLDILELLQDLTFSSDREIADVATRLLQDYLPSADQ